MKCINPAIGRDLPGLGNPGLRTAETIEMEQALEESISHAPIKLACDFRRIDRLRFGAVEDHQVGA